MTKAENVAQICKFDEKNVVTYKVGKGTRVGAPVDIDTLKSVIGKKPLSVINDIEKYGPVNFTNAFLNVREIDVNYFGVGSGMTITYTLFGTDGYGNEIVYDKYEGNTAGGGQSFVFVNGVKEKATWYSRQLVKDYEFERALTELMEATTR